MYIAISKDEGVSEHTLMKRIHTLYRVVSFLFGPVMKRSELHTFPIIH